MNLLLVSTDTGADCVQYVMSGTMLQVIIPSQLRSKESQREKGSDNEKGTQKE